MKIWFSGDFYLQEELTVSFEMQSSMAEADVRILNLEAPLASEDLAPIAKVGPHMNQPSAAIKSLGQLGVDAVTLANNHAFDYDKAGLDKTIALLSEAEIGFFGAGDNLQQALRPLVLQNDDVSVAIIGVADSEFGHIREGSEAGYAWINHLAVDQHIASLAKEYDHVIVVCHAGLEMVDVPLPEWRARYKNLCDIGASAVIAHHPHVMQGYEIHEGKPIFYSLGEFAFTTNDPDQRRNKGLSVTLQLKKDELDFSLTGHRFENGVLSALTAEEFDQKLTQLQKALSSQSYSQLVNRAVLECYSSYYRQYQLIAATGAAPAPGLLGAIKYIIKRYLYLPVFKAKAEREKRLMTRHNLEIDTHRYVITRAMHLLEDQSQA